MRSAENVGFHLGKLPLMPSDPMGLAVESGFVRALWPEWFGGSLLDADERTARGWTSNPKAVDLKAPAEFSESLDQ